MAEIKTHLPALAVAVTKHRRFPLSNYSDEFVQDFHLFPF